jgi:hypothetical protein
MRRLVLIAVLVIVVALVVAGAAPAFGDEQPQQAGMGWTQIGTQGAIAVGTVIGSAAAAMMTALGTQRMGRPQHAQDPPTRPISLPPEVSATLSQVGSQLATFGAELARIDERTEATQEGMVRLERRIETIAKRQHKQGQALLVLTLRDGHTPEEQAALASLDDSDGGDG